MPYGGSYYIISIALNISLSYPMTFPIMTFPIIYCQKILEGGQIDQKAQGDQWKIFGDQGGGRKGVK